jgi:hypothetical protein
MLGSAKLNLLRSLEDLGEKIYRTLKGYGYVMRRVFRPDVGTDGH